MSFLNGEKNIQNPEKLHIQSHQNIFESQYDFKYIIGQNQAKRALEIAAA
ncbi:MAG: hypothetical protein PHS78_10715 [Aliarcobacter skirrowii]|nr:hypothetical protein [Aliarcobacter skirrowii]MDD2509494.1 hypothetical protein [Aliarcobacter skirrowii]